MSEPGGGSPSSPGPTTPSPQNPVPVTHIPLTQRPDMHALLQPPQCLGSVEMSVHTPLQNVPVGQGSTQAPSTHSARPGQETPQLPQFDESERQSTQAPEQYRYSGGHVAWQTPPEQ